MLEAARRYPSLSPATQALLDPFFSPPTDAGSWFNAWIYFQLPAPLTYAVGDDGTTLEASISTPEGGGTRVRKWTLHSTAE